ncbi:MAG TPA: tRNA uridine-5-carboxymethylaminomethyl(34) synthesis GTPase MnmE, partial [Gemmatimonadales bacterium]
MLSDPIVALATPPGRSAVALLRLSGRGAFALAEKCLSPWRNDPPRTVFRARLATPAGVPVDDVLAALFPGPNSYTGEDLVEISTHGGLLAPAEAMAALVAAGARPAEPGEFTRRAVLNGKMDLLQAEATADLIDASAPAQRRRALAQLDQSLSKRLDALRSEILELEGLTAYEIDFPEEDDGPVAPERVVKAWKGVRARVAELLGTAAEGERLREGALLVIAGPPNAGKSTLFNALLGSERAIVTEIPGTTRDAIEAPAVIAGFPFRLVDTAGLRDSEDRIEKMGIEVSKRYLDAADLILYCGDARGLSASVTIIEVQTKADLRSDGVGVSAVT